MTKNSKKPRPNTLETTLLAIEMLRRIPRNYKVTAIQLQAGLRASGFERDIRSIQRILKGLCEHYKDIICDNSSNPYGYKWKDGAITFSLPALNDHESLLLTLAHKQLSPLLPPAIKNGMSGFFYQAGCNLRNRDKAVLEKQWLKKVRVVSETQPLIPPSLSEGVLDAVSQALYNNKYLSIVYTNARDSEKNSFVMPLGLVQQGPRLYLVCRYQGYDNERILALHRIKSAQVSNVDFTRPDFDLAQYELEGSFGVGDGKWIQLNFYIKKATGKNLLESPLSLDQKHIETEDEYQITATVVQSLLLDRWLNSFGDQIRDIKKQEIEGLIKK